MIRFGIDRSWGSQNPSDLADERAQRHAAQYRQRVNSEPEGHT